RAPSSAPRTSSPACVSSKLTDSRTAGSSSTSKMRPRDIGDSVSSLTWEKERDPPVAQRRVQPFIPITKAGIGDVVKAHAERQRYSLGRKILNTGATFQDKVERRALFRNARRQISPRHAKAKVPEGHPPAESQEVVLEQQGPTGRNRRKRF